MSLFQDKWSVTRVEPKPQQTWWNHTRRDLWGHFRHLNHLACHALWRCTSPHSPPHFLLTALSPRTSAHQPYSYPKKSVTPTLAARLKTVTTDRTGTSRSLARCKDESSSSRGSWERVGMGRWVWSGKGATVEKDDGRSRESIKERFRIKVLHSIHTFSSTINGSGVRLCLTKQQFFS